MVLFVFGPSHVGKTFFASRLTNHCGISSLSIDLLKMGLIRSGIVSLTPEDDDALVDVLWPIVREMVQTALENNQNLIVEGDYLPTDWRISFSKEADVMAIGLAMTEAHLRDHYDEIIQHRHAIEIRHHEAPTFEELVQAHTHTRTQCMSGYSQLVLIDGDYQYAINRALEFAIHLFEKDHKYMNLPQEMPTLKE